MTQEEYKKSGKKLGALKRKLGIKVSEKVEPGDLINKVKPKLTKREIAIRGLV